MDSKANFIEILRTKFHTLKLQARDCINNMIEIQKIEGEQVEPEEDEFSDESDSKNQDKIDLECSCLRMHKM